jgi:hypothetical protein
LGSFRKNTPRPLLSAFALSAFEAAHLVRHRSRQ